MAEGLTFGVLGPLEARRGDAVVSLPSAKERLVLARLLVSAAAVSEDELVDALWGEAPPPSAPGTLRAHVSRLRRRLQLPDGPAVLVHGPDGYRLVGGVAVDARSFQEEVEAARAASQRGADDRARGLLDRALGRWRGEALSGFRFEPFAQAPIARWEALRLDALEDRIRLDLDGGRAREVVPELVALVHSHPLRERFHELLVLALHRTGRTADALAAYREARRTLVDELGIEPSPALQRAHESILRGEDPAAGADRHARVTAEGRLSGAWRDVAEVELPTVDATVRCDLLLSRGSRLRRAGEVDASREAYAAAARLAAAAGRPAQLAAAVLGLVGPPEDSLSTVPLDESLVERALLRLPEDDPVVAPLRARLAVALVDRGEHERGVRMLEAALEHARATGDALATAYVRRARHRSWFSPDELPARRSSSEELLRLGDELDQPEIRAWGHRWRAITALEAGDLADVASDLDALQRIAEDQDDAFHRWFVVTRRAGLDLLQQPTERAERAVLGALALTDEVRSDYTLFAAMMLLFTCRWLQGRWDDAAGITRQVAPALPIADVVQGFLAAEAGRADEVRASLDRSFAAGFDAVLAWDRIGAARLVTLALLGETAATLAHVEAAQALGELLEPYAGRFVVVAPGVTALTTTDHVLGRLAATCGDVGTAEAAYERALRFASDRDATTVVPRTQLAYAQLLAGRRGREDEARALVADARRRSEALGLGHPDHLVETRVVAGD